MGDCAPFRATANLALGKTVVLGAVVSNARQKEDKYKISKEFNSSYIRFW